MLEDTRPVPVNFAWLADSQHKRALDVRFKRGEPQAGELSFFCPDFALNDPEPWLRGEEIDFPARVSMHDVPLPSLTHRVEPSAADFNRMHEEILERIRAGEFDKVVPVVREELEFERELEPSMFPAAFRDLEHQFAYGFCFNGEGLCGITPELLFSVQDGVLHTMALAGTGRVDGPDLLNDPKEKHEHELVIEHVVGEVKRWGRADVGVTQERPYGVLKHLYTPIRVELESVPSFVELVVRLHPTAALGGWPRKPAVEWLERQHFHSTRGRFGAPFGYQDGARMECVVAIRCLQWHGRRASVSAGCGVVSGSLALKEWKELQLKRQSVYRNLGLPL